MPTPRISVVIAAYRPGEGFDRVMRSLDEQTLPQDEFETIVVDDGSPDDTFDRISRLAATRPNMRVERIENSGWPSRPRNVATAMARGEYVFFMDHDDSLYPDALRRMAEYAAETRADVLSPKESKTSDAWWGMPALRNGNVANAVATGGIDDLLPMVPHKLYRRAFLDEHGIRFPEGRRQLWEDIYVNVEAWRHAERVAVLADTPAYLWWSSRTNNSKTYGPRHAEFWDRLDELFGFIDMTLDGPDHADARRSALLHQYTGRVLTRLSRNLRHASASEAELGMRRATALQRRYIPEEWDALLGEQPRARALLLRAGRADLLAALWAVDSDTAAAVDVEQADWAAGALHLRLRARWTDRAGDAVPVRRDGDRLMRVLPQPLREALPTEVLDVTDTLSRFRLELGVRDRDARVTWQVEASGAAQWEERGDGTVAPVLRAAAAIDPAAAAMGGALEPHVHDVVANLHWASASRSTVPRYDGIAASAVAGGRPAVAYRTLKGGFAFDLGARLRNPVADGGSANGRVPGTLHALSLPLPRVRSTGSAVLPAALQLTSETGAEVVLAGELHADRDGGRLDVGTPERLSSGAWSASFSVDGGPFLGRRPARVRGTALELLPRDPAVPERQPPWSAGVRRGRRLLTDLVREVHRRLRR